MTERDTPVTALRPARTGGKRRLTFDNGRYQEYQAVFVQHEASGGEWDRILIARDDGTIARLLVDLINGASSDDVAGSGERLELTARLAIVNHIAGEDSDCDGDEAKDWCQACWDSAVEFIAPDATYAVAEQARAALAAPTTQAPREETPALDVETCPVSQRADGRHSWRFDGDDPYVVCFYCDERRDAVSGRVR